ncbi:MAG TPA: PKD domain-containing protein, partial [Gemmatimonadales bacterium]|nr:PKD domain-containing protein [Gemmatimonadales bacterium]
NDAGVGQAITPPVSVVITDSTGHPVPGYSGSVTISLGANATGATLSGANTATATNGIATFTGLSVNRAGSGYTLNAASSGLAGATSSPFDVTSRPAPPPTHVAFITQPTTARAGVPIAPAIQVAAEDSTGGIVSTYTGAITIALGGNPGGGTLSGTRVLAATNGVATFSTLSIDKAGVGYTLTASAAGLTGGTSSSFDISALPPPPPMATALVFTAQPQSAQAGASLGTITVAAVDSAGATVSDFSGTVNIAIGANPSGGTLSGTTSAVTSGGVATFSTLSIDKAGTGYTLSASTLGLKGAASATFAVTAPPPTTGSLVVSTTTTGSNLDADGYTATVDGGTSQPIGDNAGVTFANLPAGSHTVVLSGLAANCSVGNASQTATVPAGGSASVAYAVTCQAPPPTTGSLTVTTNTTGATLDPDGYSVSVDGGGGAQSISDNGSVTFNNLSSGSHTVSLSGLATNCTAGSTSQSVSVPAGGSTSASFAITCQSSPPPTNHPPVVNAGGNQSALVAVLYQLNASFTDQDGDGPWTYSINWGDGSSSTGSLSAQGGIGPTHTYALPGAYAITVTVTDAHGATGSDTKTLNVTL